MTLCCPDSPPFTGINTIKKYAPGPSGSRQAGGVSSAYLKEYVPAGYRLANTSICFCSSPTIS